MRRMTLRRREAYPYELTLFAQVAGVVQRYERELFALRLKDIDRTRVLPEAPETVVAQPQHA